MCSCCEIVKKITISGTLTMAAMALNTESILTNMYEKNETTRAGIVLQQQHHITFHDLTAQ